MREKRNLKKLLISVLMMALVAAMAIIGTACNKKAEEVNEAVASEVTAAVEEEISDVASEVASEVTEEAKQIGEGETDFSLEVVYADGSTDYFAVKTDAEDLGTALLDAGIVEGEDSDYGLYIKSVNGVTADYDTDQSWWGFYVNDEMASVGVSDTKVEEGAKYSLKYEK